MSKFTGLALAVEKPRRLYLVHPVTREFLSPPVGPGTSRSTMGEYRAYIDVWSYDSDPARQARQAIARRRAEQRGPIRITAEEAEADAVALLAAVTAGWSLVDLSGAPIDVPFSPDAAAELYAEPGLAWLRDQVDAFAGDRGNFGPASSAS